MKTLLPFLMLVLFFGSCCPKEDITIAENDRNWTPYVKDQEIVFSSDNHSDTLKVIVYENSFSDDQHCPIQRERIRVKLASKTHDSLNFMFSLSSNSISMSAELGTPVNLFCGWNYEENKPSTINNEEYKVDLIETLELNNQTYYNVIHAVRDSSEYDLYYSKGVGLIKYKFNEESYVLE